MKNSEVLDHMLVRFGDRKSPSLRSNLLIELNEKLRQLDQSELIPWFNEKRWETNLVATQPYLDLPSDFIREVEEGKFKIRNTNVSPNLWTPLVKVSLEKLEEETENFDPALPAGYALFGKRVYFGPTPDQAYAIKLPYYGRSGSILDDAAEVTNEWLINFYNFITLDTIDLVARTKVRDEKLVNLIGNELVQAHEHMSRAIEARQHVNMDYLLTDEE
jgi:hypothetical protein